MKKKILTVVILMLLWQLFAVIVNNTAVIPLPIEVVKYMSMNALTMAFYRIVLTTITRLIIGLGISLFLGVALALIAGLFPFIEELFSPLNNLIKAVPTMSYLIILLIWFGSEKSAIIILICVIFPIFYSNALVGFKQLNTVLKNVLLVYPTTLKEKIFGVYLPQIKPFVYSSVRLAVGMGLKVIVMAEVMGQVKVGIGKQLYYGKVIFDMTAIFSWTLWVVLLVIGIDWILERLEGYILAK